VLLGYFLVAPIAASAPFVPTAGDQVLEQLPATLADQQARELRVLRAALSADPDNLTLAIQVASDYLETGRVTGDPRYAGYAQSALTPWWNETAPPVQVLILRAQLRQRAHAFGLALKDLNSVLNVNPREARARLLRATIRQVIADYPAAEADCAVLARVGNPLFGDHCRSSIMSMTGQLPEAIALLAPAARHAQALDAGTRAWVLTSLGEMAERLGDMAQAEEHFRAALALTPADQYLLIAYSDFLLAEGRGAEVLPLLAPHVRVDGLMLRYALALQATGADSTDAVAQLRARFAAGAARGETVHQREHARFVLEFEQEPARALQLALSNWAVQKETADLRILVATARAAHADQQLEIARQWIQHHKFQDSRIRI